MWLLLDIIPSRSFTAHPQDNLVHWFKISSGDSPSFKTILEGKRQLCERAWWWGWRYSFRTDVDQSVVNQCVWIGEEIADGCCETESFNFGETCSARFCFIALQRNAGTRRISACVTRTGATGGGPSEFDSNRVGPQRQLPPIVMLTENLI